MEDIDREKTAEAGAEAVAEAAEAVAEVAVEAEAGVEVEAEAAEPAEAAVTSAEEAADEAPVSPKKRKKKWPIVVGAIAVVIAACGIGFSVWHQSPTFCNAICHSPMDRYVESYYTGDDMARVHAEAGVSCLDCHEATLALQVHEAITWIKGDYRSKLDMISYDSTKCLECHDKAAVKECTAQMVKEGIITKDPHADIHQVMDCMDCHRSHRDQVDYCTTCHDNGGQVMIAYPLAREYDMDTTPDW